MGVDGGRALWPVDVALGGRPARVILRALVDKTVVTIRARARARAAGMPGTGTGTMSPRFSPARPPPTAYRLCDRPATRTYMREYLEVPVVQFTNILNESRTTR